MSFCPDCGNDIGESNRCKECDSELKWDGRKFEGNGTIIILDEEDKDSFYFKLNDIIEEGRGIPLYESFNVSRTAVSAYQNEYIYDERYHMLIMYSDKDLKYLKKENDIYLIQTKIRK